MDYRQSGLVPLVEEARGLKPTKAELDAQLRDLTRFRAILDRGAESIVEELASLDEEKLGRKLLASEGRRRRRLLLDLRDLSSVLPDIGVSDHE
jgi:hypothetical protein